MIKFIAILTLAIMPLCAESIDEMKQRFMDEMKACDVKYSWTVLGRVQCRLEANTLMLMLLIEQMKEKK